MTDDYLQYYDLESYLFETVKSRFHQNGKLDAFDLFSIIIWKANRAKSKLAHRLLLSRESKKLDAVSEEFTRALFEATNAESRLILAMDVWGFYLPMASAILSVLWPEDFTVFDIQVCEELASNQTGDVQTKDFSKLGNKSTKHLWLEYREYCEAVKKAAPQHLSLRDKDRFLWGRSAARQLADGIARGFSKPGDPSMELSGTLNQ